MDTVKRIGIIEDEPQFVKWLENAFKQIGSCELAFSASSLGEADENLKLHSVDLLLVDLGLPDGNGADFILKVFKKYPDIQSCVLSAMDDGAMILNALFQGADGFLVKNKPEQQLFEDLKATLEGDVADSAPVNQHILRFAKKTAEYRASLSERELEIIKLLANGYCQKEVANKLGLKVLPLMLTKKIFIVSCVYVPWQKQQKYFHYYKKGC